jgi:hypothetical protein
MSKIFVKACTKGALEAAEAWARETLPLSKRHLDRAIRAIDNGDVQILTQRLALVTNTHITHEYMVLDDACECRVFRKAPQGLCTHRVAVAILRHAIARTQWLDTQVGDLFPDVYDY